VVVVAVTRVVMRLLLLLLVFLCSRASYALVLPEDRADVLYHSYDGGDVTVSGPSVLVRKSIGDSVSISANHYVDSVSSASIDVVTQASAYTEERDQQSLSIDYLYDKSILSYSYTSSIESDYEAITQSINISQEMFGGLTTVGLGYSIGNNRVGKVNDPLDEPVTLRSYRITLSQVLTKNTIMSLVYEIITDEGLLNNPYRSVRFLNPANTTRGFDYESEVYPNTRTSNAVAAAFKYYLPYRAAFSLGFRTFTDTWQVSANNFEIGYVHPINEDWLFEVDFRFYSQTKASFYDDLFDFTEQFQFRARDKELSTYSYNSIGAGVSYEFGKDSVSWIKKGSVNLSIDHFAFDYEDFLDVRNSTFITVGQEPAYSFSANVIRFYLSVWF
jgi:Protein of unknown function (DUF3570)